MKTDGWFEVVPQDRGGGGQQGGCQGGGAGAAGAHHPGLPDGQLQPDGGDDDSVVLTAGAGALLHRPGGHPGGHNHHTHKVLLEVNYGPSDVVKQT